MSVEYGKIVGEAIYGLVSKGVRVVIDMSLPCVMIEDEIADLYATYGDAGEGEEWRNMLINASLSG